MAGENAEIAAKLNNGICGKALGLECQNCQPLPTKGALRQAQKKELADVAASLIATGKGIFAADESTVTIGKRFAKVGIHNDEENRRQYRLLLFTAGKDAFNNISGVIFFHETLYQKDDEGVPLIKRTKDNGALVGIRVDKGVTSLAGTANEQTTQGLDGLDARCKRYKLDGCDFAKWKCVYRVGETTPSQLALTENAYVLARYASCCQQAGLVPLIQAELIADGSHCLGRAEEVTEQVLREIYSAMLVHHVWTEGTILAPSIVTCGADCNESGATPFDVAGATIVALQRTVPPSVPGVAFVCEYRSEEEATEYLDAINKYPAKKPWILTFCYGRPLQDTALATWKADDENVIAAQTEFSKRTKFNGLAALGRYKIEAEGSSSGKKFVPPEQLY